MKTIVVRIKASPSVASGRIVRAEGLGISDTLPDDRCIILGQTAEDDPGTVRVLAIPYLGKQLDPDRPVAVSLAEEASIRGGFDADSPAQCLLQALAFAITDSVILEATGHRTQAELISQLIGDAKPILAAGQGTFTVIRSVSRIVCRSGVVTVDGMSGGQWVSRRTYRIERGEKVSPEAATSLLDGLAAAYANL